METSKARIDGCALSCGVLTVDANDAVNVSVLCTDLSGITDFAGKKSLPDMLSNNYIALGCRPVRIGSGTINNVPDSVLIGCDSTMITQDDRNRCSADIAIGRRVQLTDNIARDNVSIGVYNRIDSNSNDNVFIGKNILASGNDLVLIGDGIRRKTGNTSSKTVQLGPSQNISSYVFQFNDWTLLNQNGQMPEDRLSLTLGDLDPVIP